MERVKTYEGILAELQAAGIKENKLTKAFSVSSLPSSGTFVDYKTEVMKAADGTENPYAVIICDDGSKISMGAIQALAYFGTLDDDTEFKENVNPDSPAFGNFALSGKKVKAVNPHLTGDQARVIARILDKKFTTTIKEAYTIPFGSPQKTKTQAKTSAKLKDFYHITLVTE